MTSLQNFNSSFKKSSILCLRISVLGYDHIWEKIETLSIYFCIPMSYLQGCGAVQILDGSDSRSSPENYPAPAPAPSKMSQQLRLRLRLRAKCNGQNGQNVISWHFAPSEMSQHLRLRLRLRAKCTGSGGSGSRDAKSRKFGTAPAPGAFPKKKLIPPPPPAPSIIFERHRLPTKCAGSSSASLPMWPWPVTDNSYKIDLYLVIRSSEL